MRILLFGKTWLHWWCSEMLLFRDDIQLYPYFNGNFHFVITLTRNLMLTLHLRSWLMFLQFPCSQGSAWPVVALQRTPLLMVFCFFPWIRAAELRHAPAIQSEGLKLTVLFRRSILISILCFFYWIFNNRFHLLILSSILLNIIACITWLDLMK